MNQFYKNLSLWLVISLMMILLFNMFNKPHPTAEKLNFSDFMTQVETGKITSVVIQGNDISGKFEGKDGKEFHTYKPYSDADLTKNCWRRRLRSTPNRKRKSFPGFRSLSPGSR